MVARVVVAEHLGALVGQRDEGIGDEAENVPRVAAASTLIQRMQRAARVSNL